MGVFGDINALQQFWDRNKKVIDKILFYLKNHKRLCVTIIAVILIFVIGIADTEQKTSHISEFVGIVRKFEHIEELTADIIHEMIEKIVVYAPDKSSGHRIQQIDIHYRFNVAVSVVFADSRKYHENGKAA